MVSNRWVSIGSIIGIALFIIGNFIPLVRIVTGTVLLLGMIALFVCLWRHDRLEKDAQ